VLTKLYWQSDDSGAHHRNGPQDSNVRPLMILDPVSSIAHSTRLIHHSFIHPLTFSGTAARIPPFIHFDSPHILTPTFCWPDKGFQSGSPVLALSQSHKAIPRVLSFRLREMSSPWKKKQPEVVVDAVLKRAEVGKVNLPLPDPNYTVWNTNGNIPIDRTQAQSSTRPGAIQSCSRVGGSHSRHDRAES
jgi:hypothetical protein